MLRNRYRLIQSLGSERFGKTYLAEDIDKLNERCVIKQFAPQVQGTAVINKATELFEQEARRLQQLGEHPQIPALLAYFQEDNRLYLVQEFIDGQNLLDELKQQGTFSEQGIRKLLLDLLDILKTVHQQKVIHRDIKPENIIRRSDGKLVLINFGASKELTAAVMSVQGTTIGSFGYAPPEQIQDSEAYPASDLFSLGATSFHLLTGIHPWGLFTKQGFGWLTKWYKYLQQPVSEEFGLILNKLLQKDYHQRYQKVEEVLQGLNLSPLPLPSVPTSQPIIETPEPVTVPSQPQASTASAPVERKPSKQNTKFRKRLLAVAAITLAGLVGTQIYGYVRYGLFPTNLISIIVSKPNDVFLQRTLTGHSKGVRSVAISPDGKTLISSSYDKTIKLWNLATGKQIRTFTGHSNWVYSVAISPDGKTLASGSGDKTIKLWNLATGEQIRTLTGHSEGVISVAFSPDGKTLVSGSGDKTIKLWNLVTGKQIRTLTGHSEGVRSVAISPDGKTLTSGSYDKTTKLWNLATGKQIRTLAGHSKWVGEIAFSPDGKTLANVSLDKTIKLWNLATGEQIRTLTGHSRIVNSIAISQDGKTLVSGSDDNTIKIWRLL